MPTVPRVALMHRAEYVLNALTISGRPCRTPTVFVGAGFQTCPCGWRRIGDTSFTFCPDRLQTRGVFADQHDTMHVIGHDRPGI